MTLAGPLDWVIRPAGPADAEALALLAQATFLEAFAGLVARDDMLAHAKSHNSAEAFSDAFSQGARIWLGEAAATRAPLGYAMLAAPGQAGARPGDIELKRIYVLDRCQGQGLADALLFAVIAAAKEQERLVLGVNRDNLRAQAFYRKHGFVSAGPRAFQVGSATFDDFLYALPLCAADKTAGTP